VVLGLETFKQKLTSIRTAELQWIDAKTGRVTRSEDLYGEWSDNDCTRATRKAKRRLRALNEELAATSWEPMTPVPLRRIHEDAYDNLRADLEEAEGEDKGLAQQAAQDLMPRGQVHVVVRRDGAVVRLPGVKVYERNVALHPRTLSQLVGHRPSGIVAARHSDCVEDEDCTCNLEATTTVLRWSPATLEAIDANPCELTRGDGFDDSACVFSSVFED
jgi:hypothetical protein